MLYHGDVFELLGARPRASTKAEEELSLAEERLGLRLPASVREWYSNEDALSILAEHSNGDPPIPVREFAVSESGSGRMLPIRRENQGVCTWSILLDGTDDPPVYVSEVDSASRWQLHAPAFSTYVYSCVWDYGVVIGRLALVQAQHGPISDRTLRALADAFVEGPRTFGWPGSMQHRFSGDRHGLLIWADHRTDWMIGAADGPDLESALRLVWDLDGVGASFYGCTEIAENVLARLRERS
jgi:hypothetical protein